MILPVSTGQAQPEPYQEHIHNITESGRKEEMKLEILNGELGIAVIDSLEDLGYIQAQKIKKQLPQGSLMEELAFFYMSDRDWIVINRSHKMYEFYSFLITTYLTLSNENRKVAREKAPTDSIKDAVRILEDIINRRIFIYGPEHAEKLFGIKK